jgi:malate dehydrogenase
MNRKVTVVGGAGAVGATVARAIADKELADVVIIDIAETKAGGVGLDMLEACPIEGSDARVVGYGANDEGWAATAGSDVVVITSGVPRKPGMSRDDLLNVNYKIMQSVTEQIVKHSPKTIIVPVANPLDAMCQAVYRLSGFPRERVIGMAGVLDSARMRTFIAMETGVSVENIHAFVLGATRWCHYRAIQPLREFRCRIIPDSARRRLPRSASGQPRGGPRSRNWLARARGTRQGLRRLKWSRSS